MENVFCIKCGKANPGEAVYCWSCGSSIVSATGVALRESRVPTPAFPRSDPNPLPTIEIRPKSMRNGILLAVGCAVFSAGGVWMLSSNDTKEVAIGLLSLIFFGGGGIFAVPKIIRLEKTFILSSDSLTQISPYGNTDIPWSDVEKIGLVKIQLTDANVLVGIRLKTYDRYLAAITPEMAAVFAKFLPAIRVAAVAIPLLNLPQEHLFKIWSAFTGTEEPTEVLKSCGKIGSYAQALLWGREHYGYDLMFGWAQRDRSAKEFASLLETYRSRTIKADQ